MLDSKSLAILENSVGVLASHIKATISSEINVKKRFFALSCRLVKTLAQDLLGLHQL